MGLHIESWLPQSAFDWVGGYDQARRENGLDLMLTPSPGQTDWTDLPLRPAHLHAANYLMSMQCFPHGGNCSVFGFAFEICTVTQVMGKPYHFFRIHSKYMTIYSIQNIYRIIVFSSLWLVSVSVGPPLGTGRMPAMFDDGLDPSQCVGSSCWS